MTNLPGYSATLLIKITKIVQTIKLFTFVINNRGGKILGLLLSFTIKLSGTLVKYLHYETYSKTSHLSLVNSLAYYVGTILFEFPGNQMFDHLDKKIDVRLVNFSQRLLNFSQSSGGT